jgi:prevent-host-death family protein
MLQNQQIQKKSISEFAADSASLIRKVHSTKQPLLLTENNENTAILVDSTEYALMEERMQMLARNCRKKSFRAFRRMKIRWSPLAVSRITDIGDYIAIDYPERALRIVKEIIRSVSRLKQFPKSGRIVPEFENPDIREVLHPPYRILYQEYGDAIEILTVMHSRQLLTEEKLEG